MDLDGTDILLLQLALEGNWPNRKQISFQHQFIRVNNKLTFYVKMAGKEVTTKSGGKNSHMDFIMTEYLTDLFCSLTYCTSHL